LDSLKEEVREINEYANTALRLAIKEVVEKHSLICSAESKHVQELETLVGVYRDQISRLRAFITKQDRLQVDHEQLQTTIRTQLNLRDGEYEHGRSTTWLVVLVQAVPGQRAARAWLSLRRSWRSMRVPTVTAHITLLSPHPP
jgi:hypothetical protein